MIRDFSVVLMSVEGKPLQADGQLLTMKLASVNALMMPFEDEKSLSGAEKYKRYQLAQRIMGFPGALELSIEEANILKIVIGKAYTPAVVGPAYEILEA